MFRLKWATVLWLLAFPALSDPTFEAAATVTECNDAATCEIDDSGVTINTGDLVCIVANVSDVGDAIESEPRVNETGFTTRGHDLYTGGTDKWGLFSCKIADGTEPSTYTVDSTGANYDGTEEIDGTVLVFNSVHTDVVDAACVVGGEATDSTTYDPPAIITVTDNALVLAFLFTVEHDATTWTDPSGYSRLFAHDGSGGAVSNETGVAALLNATPDSEDPGTFGSLGTNADPTGFTCALKAAEVAGEFSVNPTVTAQDTNDYTLGGTTDASADIDAVACKKDSATPDIAELQAQDCDGGVAAEANAADTWNGADSLVLGGALTLKIYDLYITEGTNLVSLLDEQLDVAAGYERTILSAQDPTSVYTGTETASGDYCDTELVTSPGAYVVTPAVDGTIEYAAGGDTSRQIILGNCHDLSESDIDSYQFVYNNQAPEIIPPGEWIFENSALYEVGTDPAIDLSELVEDAELDDIDFSVTAGALPTDWVLTGETGVISDGIPGACQADTAVTIRLTDAYGATTDIPGEIAIGTTAPDVVTGGVDEATAIAAIEAQNAAEGCLLTAAAGTPAYSHTVAVGDVISTDPAADTLVELDQEVTYVLSLGEFPPGGGGGMRLRLELRL